VGFIRVWNFTTLHRSLGKRMILQPASAQWQDLLNANSTNGPMPRINSRKIRETCTARVEVFVHSRVLRSKTISWSGNHEKIRSSSQIRNDPVRISPYSEYVTHLTQQYS